MKCPDCENTLLHRTRTSFYCCLHTYGRYKCYYWARKVATKQCRIAVWVGKGKVLDIRDSLWMKLDETRIETMLLLK